MPAIMVEAGPLTNEQKIELGRRITKDAAEVLGLPEEAFMIFLRENPMENVIVGGMQLSERKRLAQTGE